MAKIIEVEFKGGRKAFFANPQEFPFVVGDMVVVQAEKGEDLGRVVNIGSLVDKRAGDEEHPQIYRKPSAKDLEQLEENHQLEEDAFSDCKKRIEEHGLEMKLVDVEYQFDRNKITFYFTSESRVDFRALVRDLASRYRTRIELRQIGVRDEAKRIGGLGVCGRRHCCTTFLREFEPVVTQFAKDQNLALNPTKLSGGCGRLMCCLRYERDLYAETLQKFPEIGTKIKTAKGLGTLAKVDIFKETGTLYYESEEQDELALEDINAALNSEKSDKHKKKKRPKNKKRKEDKKGEESEENSGH